MRQLHWVFKILVEDRNKFEKSFCSQYWIFYSSETVYTAVTVNGDKSNRYVAFRKKEMPQLFIPFPFK